MQIRFTIFVLLFCSIKAFPANIPSLQTYNDLTKASIIPAFNLSVIAEMKTKEIEKIIGRKLKLKEKIVFKIVKWKIKHGLKIAKQDDAKDKGKTAMLFGIIAIGSLLIPYIGILISLVFTILALVFGYQAKKLDPNDKKAKTAIILGWIAVGLYLLAVAIVIAILSNWVK